MIFLVRIFWAFALGARTGVDGVKWIDTVKGELNWPFHGRQRRLLRQREHWDSERFLACFSLDQASQTVAAAVWDLLVSISTVEAFRPHPDDSLGRVYGLAEEDLDEDVVLVLAQRFWKRAPTSPDEAWPTLVTVRDLVEFVLKGI